MSPRHKVLRISLVAGVLFASGLFQAWFLGIHPGDLTHRQPRGDLVDAYTVALARGRSYLLPSEPGGPGPARALNYTDASVFRGHLYVYYGIGPFAWLLVPWFKLTGTFLAAEVATLAALLLGYSGYGVALLALFGADRRRAVTWAMSAGVLAAIAASSTWSLMDLPNIHQLESSWGYAMTGCAFACLTVAITGRRGKLPALGAAALFGSLIMACRPNCFPMTAVIVGAVGGITWKLVGPASWKRLAAVGAPVALVALALAAWNYGRFGNVLEFGMSFGSGVRDNREVLEFSGGNMRYNLHRYLVGGVRWSPYFPFIAGVKPGPFPLPAGIHSAVDQLYGCAILFPVLAFAALSLRKRPAVSIVALVGALGNLAFLSGLGFGNYRYPVDYLGAVAFAAAVGIGCLPAVGSAVTRFVAGFALVPALLWSGGMSLCLAVSIKVTDNLFDTARPGDFARIARPFNSVAYLLERLRGDGPRAIRLRLSLPTDQYGKTEPLLVYGDPGAEDFIYLYYTGKDLIQVGFESMGRGGPVGAPERIDYARTHVVSIFLGNLLPPDDHPLVRGMPRGDLLLLRRFMRVSIDDRILLEDWVTMHPPKSRFFWGQSPDESAFGRRFSGPMLRVERPLMTAAGSLPSWTRADFGAVKLEVEAAPIADGAREPLLAFGNKPRGCLLALVGASPGQVRLGLFRSGTPPIYSRVFDWPSPRPRALEFKTGALLPPCESSLWPPEIPEAVRMVAKQTMSCAVDGQEIWRCPVEAQDAPPASVRIGENSVFIAGIPATLAGKIRLLERERP